MAAAGGAVIAAAAWRRARAGSPAGAGRVPPAPPPHRAGRAARRRSGGRRIRRRAPRPRRLRALHESVPPRLPRPARGGPAREPLGERLGRQRGRREQLPLAGPDAGEDLAAAGVEDGRDRSAGCAGARGERGERRHRHQRQAARLRERPRRRDADPQAGEAARADADRDPLDVGPSDAGLGQRPLDEHEQPARVLAARARRRVVARLDHAPAVQQHAGDGRRRGGVDARRGSRAAHLDPAPVAAGVLERHVARDPAAAEQRGGLGALRPLDERHGVGPEVRVEQARVLVLPGPRAGRGRGARAGRRRRRRGCRPRTSGS